MRSLTSDSSLPDDSKPKWQKQFGRAAWYKPDPSFTEAKLPPVAKANVQKLKDLKAKKQGCE